MNQAVYPLVRWPEGDFLSVVVMQRYDMTLPVLSRLAMCRSVDPTTMLSACCAGVGNSYLSTLRSLVTACIKAI